MAENAIGDLLSGATMHGQRIMTLVARRGAHNITYLRDGTAIRYESGFPSEKCN